MQGLGQAAEGAGRRGLAAAGQFQGGLHPGAGQQVRVRLETLHQGDTPILALGGHHREAGLAQRVHVPPDGAAGNPQLLGQLGRGGLALAQKQSQNMDETVGFCHRGASRQRQPGRAAFQ